MKRILLTLVVCFSSMASFADEIHYANLYNGKVSTWFCWYGDSRYGKFEVDRIVLTSAGLILMYKSRCVDMDCKVKESIFLTTCTNVNRNDPTRE